MDFWPTTSNIDVVPNLITCLTGVRFYTKGIGLIKNGAIYYMRLFILLSFRCETRVFFNKILTYIY